jgi:hypothetical protein
VSRAHVFDHVTQLIWWALTGVLRDAGMTADPDAPVPATRPALTLRTGDLAAASRGSR